MTSGPAGPLSRPFPVGRVTPEGIEAEVVATPGECEALARDLGLPALRDLVGRYRLTGAGRRVRVAGRVTATVEQVCVVSLDVFPSRLDEEVEVAFEEPRPESARRGSSGTPEVEIEVDPDEPEQLVGDQIDLGAVTAEFLALGLDPYPRKPGVAFEAPAGGPGEASPFAGLAVLKGGLAEPD